MFKKEGGKVKGYYTTKKLILGAFKGFIVIVRIGTFDKLHQTSKKFHFKAQNLAIKYSKKNRKKMAKNTLLNPKFAIFLF